MKTFDDIKTLWQQQASADVPSLEEISRLAQKTQKGMMRKNLLATSLLAVSAIIIACIVLTADFKYATTKLGAVLVVIAIFGAIFINSQLLRLMMKTTDLTVTNEDYLKQLLRYQSKERFLQTKGMAVYFIALSLGLTIYMYEFYARDHRFGLIAYAITFAWVAVCWFYLLPRAVRKQRRKLDELIQMIQGVSKQLEGDSL
jgi:hypothetical protein